MYMRRSLERIQSTELAELPEIFRGLQIQEYARARAVGDRRSRCRANGGQTRDRRKCKATVRNQGQKHKQGA